MSSKHVIVFDREGDFASVKAAEAALSAAGFSIGQMQRGAPRALLLGRYGWIAKWRNLTHRERLAVDGEMHGGRDGSVRIVPSASANPDAVVAFERVRRISAEAFAHA